MSERILVVGPYAPYRDGIAAYVVQQVRDLRSAGNDVEVLSPRPSAAHHHLDFANPRAALALQRATRGFDRVILHFHPDYYFPQPATFRVRVTHAAALGRALRAGPPATLVLHEIDQRWGESRDAAGLAMRYFVGSFDALQVHDTAQADELADAFGADRSRISVIAHGHHFVRHVRDDRATARKKLGIEPAAHVSLCIGFVAEHKGFDRAIVAFSRANERRPADDVAGLRTAELHIVGSPSAGNPAAEQYASDLADMAAETPGVDVHPGYVSDAAFDRWLAACDLVVLPYRYIWSSGVAERAALFDRPVVATRVGGLDEQLGAVAGTRLVNDDAELTAAYVEILTAAGALPATAEAPTALPWEVGAGRADVLAEVRRRADEQRGFAFVAATDGSDVSGRASTPVTVGSAGFGRAMGHLRRIGPLARPVPVSGRPGVTGFKRIQRRLLNWEIEPIIGWVDELRQATQEAVEASASLVAERPDDADRGVAPSTGADTSSTATPPSTRKAAKPVAKRTGKGAGKSGAKTGSSARRTAPSKSGGGTTSVAKKAATPEPSTTVDATDGSGSPEPS